MLNLMIGHYFYEYSPKKDRIMTDNNKKPIVSIEITEDGSATLRNEVIDECYHSVHGARQESEHIFIESALRYQQKRDVSVFEVGFGTGLNAWLTLKESQKSRRKIDYTAIELYPVEASVYRLLNYEQENEKLFQELHNSQWECEEAITYLFHITKIEASLLDYTFDKQYDVIYFDAFSPEKQPELWSQLIFDKLFQATAVGGILTTYCAKGDVRRAMQAAGYDVERIPGPPGKRHILRAVKRR